MMAILGSSYLQSEFLHGVTGICSQPVIAILCPRYFETVSDVLSSVRKMEESLKRLKQARRSPATNPVSSSGGMSDDDKIRLQLALDVEHLGEQIQKMGLQTSDIKSFPALTELVLAARDQAAAEQP